MGRKYIKQIINENFIYPNDNVSEYDVEIVHDINNNCVSGTVTNFSATTVSSTSITFTYNSTWALNNAEPFIRNSNSLAIYSIHCIVPGQSYYKPWRLVMSRAFTSITATTFSETGVTFTITPSQMGVTSFTSGIYYFEARMIGHRCIFPICLQLTINPPTPTPTPTVTGPTRTPTPTPTRTPTPTPTLGDCLCYCVTFDPNTLPNDLYVRYSLCGTASVETELIAGLDQVINGDGTVTACICVKQGGAYATPVCVQGGIEIVCPDITWVSGSACSSYITCLPTNQCFSGTTINVTDPGWIKYTDCEGFDVYVQYTTTGNKTINDCLKCNTIRQGIPFADLAVFTVTDCGTPCVIVTPTPTATSTGPTPTPTSTPGGARLNWNYTESGGASGEMVLYVNGNVVENRFANSSGLINVNVGDSINCEVITNGCVNPNNYANAYTTSNKPILVDAACGIGNTSLFTSTYVVVSGDIGTDIFLSMFSSCDSGCV